MDAPNPPPGTNFLAVIKPSLDDTLIGHTFTAILIPLFISLFYFSTKKSRRQPIFVLNVITIFLAFAVGCLLDARAYRAILSPLNPPPLSWNLAIGVLGSVQSILVDTILLLRLIVVYPRSYMGRNRFSCLITLPILLKVARVVNLILFIKALSDATKNPATANILIGQVWSRAPYLKIEWICQLFDNTYASFFFLFRLFLRSKQGSVTTESSGSQSLTFTSKLRVLFWIAATNFVFPVLFSLVQLVIVFREVNLVIVNDVVLVNVSIAVIAVVFATIWAGSSHQTQNYEPGPGTQERRMHSNIVFQHGPSGIPTNASDTADLDGSGLYHNGGLTRPDEKTEKISAPEFEA